MAQIKFKKAAHEQFVAALAAAAWSQGNKGACVSEPRNGADVALYLSDDGMTGFALDGDYLGSVFSHADAKGRLGAILSHAKWAAIWAGKRQLTLDCFAPLGGVYARHGFAETGRAAFDWQYAPDHWVPAYGEPDVVFMALPLFANDNAKRGDEVAA